MNQVLPLIDTLESQHRLSLPQWEAIFRCDDPALNQELARRGRALNQKTFGSDIYTRGLIEFTNYCKNDCYYCGIQKSNRNAQRYRLTPEEIYQCCQEGYDLGFRTFVLQGGEDPYFTDELMCEIIATIHHRFPDCAITMSVGERTRETYQAYFDAGAERYLLRHETADPLHYSKLHPKEQKLSDRLECLWTLKDIGFQVGTGFMVGSPYQSPASLAKDMEFLQEFQPHMVGIGPFVPHHDTIFANEVGGTVADTTKCISLLRLMLPTALIPATTALGTISPNGREQGILAGANVVMPNLSPVAVRKKYDLYDNKICTGEESAQCRGCLNRRMESIDYQLVVDRGDHPERKVSHV